MALFYFAVGTAIFLVLIIRFFEKNTNAKCTSTKKLNGKTVLVTGGSAGIGLEMVKEFAHRGAKVIIASNATAEGEEAVKMVSEETGNNKIIFKYMNLASLKSVRKFADEILKEEERLDVLINNAGVGVPKQYLTNDGLNIIMQINYFGHVLLTVLLLPLLRKTGTEAEPSRIISATSLSHRFGTFNDKVNEVNRFWKLPIFVYSDSKFSLIPFSRELTRRLNSRNVVANTADPGVVGTQIYHTHFYGYLLSFLAYHLFKTAKEGAQTAIHVALDEQAGKISGGFFKNCKLDRAKCRKAYDDKLANKVWEDSIRLVNLSEHELNMALK